MKLCFKCKKEINDEDNYIIMTNMNHKKEVHTDYIHKVCWDSFCNQLDGAKSSLVKSNYLLNAIGKQMGKMGMLPDEEVVIQ